MHLLMNPQFSRIYSQTTSNNSGQAIIVHFYLSDETHEKNTEINCVRCTDKPPDSEDFFFFLKQWSKSSTELIERKVYKDLSERNISETMLRLLETPKIQLRLLIKNKIGNSFMVQRNKDPTQAQLWHRSQVWRRFNPWPGKLPHAAGAA